MPSVPPDGPGGFLPVARAVDHGAKAGTANFQPSRVVSYLKVLAKAADRSSVRLCVFSHVAHTDPQMADNGATVGPKDSRVLYWSMHTKIREHQKARNEPKSKIKTCEKQPFSTNPETADLQNYRRFVCFSESAATAAVRMCLDILCPGGLGVSGGSRRQLSGARSWGVRGGKLPLIGGLGGRNPKP